VTRLEGEGFATWAVGGAIRDALLGRPVQEWDLATAARPADVQRLFRRTVPVGIDHGTVGVLEDGHLHEVTTFRRDVRTDGRHAEVSFSDTIDEDLSRRDFTINAVAWHPLRREWKDPFQGERDLEMGLLRAVGDPAERFAEDRLRVLRGLRFAGRLDLKIDPATWEALSASTGELPALSAERVREELVKLLNDRRPSGALRLYADAGVMEALYPELTPERGVPAPAFERALEVVDRVGPHLESRMAALFLPAVQEGKADGEALGRMLERLRCSNREQKNVRRWVETLVRPSPGPGPVSRRRWLSVAGPENLRGVARVWVGMARAGQADPEETAALIRDLRGIVHRGTPLAVGDLALDGNDLKRLGLDPGPAYARILTELLDRVLEDPDLNENGVLQDAALEIAESL